MSREHPATSREQQILDAALSLFAERSFDGVGVDAIAAKVGVTGSAIYRYFSSKDEILAAAFQQLTDHLLVRLGDPLDDPRAELARLIDVYVDVTLANPEMTTVWNREQPALSQAYQRSLARRQRLYTDRWTAAVSKVYPGHSHAKVAATVRAVQSLAMSDILRPASVRRLDDLADLLKSMMTQALEALAKSPA